MFDEQTIAAIDSGRIETQPKPRSLFQFLAWRGGLRPDPELRAILDKRNPFVPGAGNLIRNTGLTLDGAREACVEAGFLPGLTSDMEEASINDFLDLVAAEARGIKQYRECDAVRAHTMHSDVQCPRGNDAAPVPTSNQRQRKENMKQHTMSADEFRKCLDKIGLSVYAAAPFFGISLRQAQRIAAGEYPAPLALVRLLRLMVKQNINAHDL